MTIKEYSDFCKAKGRKMIEITELDKKLKTQKSCVHSNTSPNKQG